MLALHSHLPPALQSLQAAEDLTTLLSPSLPLSLSPSSPPIPQLIQQLKQKTYFCLQYFSMSVNLLK